MTLEAHKNDAAMPTDAKPKTSETRRAPRPSPPAHPRTSGNCKAVQISDTGAYEGLQCFSERAPEAGEDSARLGENIGDRAVLLGVRLARNGELEVLVDVLGPAVSRGRSERPFLNYLSKAGRVPVNLEGAELLGTLRRDLATRHSPVLLLVELITQAGSDAAFPRLGSLAEKLDVRRAISGRRNVAITAAADVKYTDQRPSSRRHIQQTADFESRTWVGWWGLRSR